MTDRLEVRAFSMPLDFRADSGTAIVGGIAVPYNTVSLVAPGLREEFLPGAFGDVSALDLILNIQHRRDRMLARTGPDGGLTFNDGSDALRMTAELDESTTDGADAISLLKRRILRGLSIEFASVRESYVNGIRRISKARLGGLAIVDRPAHAGATAELRALAANCQKSLPAGYRLAWWM